MICNDVIYKDENISRRDLLENIHYDNAFWTLNYAKYLIDEKGKKNICDSALRAVYLFFEFLYEEKDNMTLFDVTEKEAEDFMYYVSTKKKSPNTTVLIRTYAVNAFYDFLILKGATSSNPFFRIKKLALLSSMNRKKLSTVNFLTDEQIEKIKNELPESLRLYAMLSLTSGATSTHIRNMKWEHFDFDKRIVIVDEEIMYFSEEVSEMLQNEQCRRIEKGLNDCGYVFRKQIRNQYEYDNYYVNDSPISKNTLSNWCRQIGEVLEIPNLRHLDFRLTAIKKFLSTSGCVGMTSIIYNYPYLSQQARFFAAVEEKNNELLQEYKDICEI